MLRKWLVTINKYRRGHQTGEDWVQKTTKFFPFHLEIGNLLIDGQIWIAETLCQQGDFNDVMAMRNLVHVELVAKNQGLLFTVQDSNWEFIVFLEEIIQRTYRLR